jgi:hypothetical protein
VVRLAWSNDPESHTGGSTATGRVSQAGQFKGDDQDKERYLGPPGWGLSVGLTALPRKKTMLGIIYHSLGMEACGQEGRGPTWAVVPTRSMCIYIYIYMYI